MLSTEVTTYKTGGGTPTDKSMHPGEYGRVSAWIRKIKNDLVLNKDIYGHPPSIVFEIPASQYESTPTTTAVDEIEQQPKDVDYKNLLTRLTQTKQMESQVIEATAKSVKPTTTTPSTGWRCYHESDPRSKSKAQANARVSAARAKTRKEKRDEGAEHINQIGIHWQDEFKRIAKSKGVSDEKLKELNETHRKEGPQECLMHVR